MPINPLIALQGQTLDTATPLRQFGQDLRQSKIDEKNAEDRDLARAREKFDQFEQREQNRITSSVMGAARLQPFLKNGDVEGALGLLNQRRQRLLQAQSEGVEVDTNETDEAIRRIQEGDIEGLSTDIDGLVDFGTKFGIVGGTGSADFSKGSGVVVRQEDGSFAQAIPILNKATGQVETKLAPIEGQPVSRLGETAGEQTNRIIIEAGGKTRASEAAKTDAIPGQVGAQSQSQRLQTQIDDGFDAVDALPVIRRGLELLDSVKTGGFNNAALRAKRLFGVEGADEAELSASLGKAVLSQLRSTFGAQFTEREGARLAEIEAGFGKSTEGNRRLLVQTEKILQRAIKRALRAARKTGDQDAIEELEEAQNFTLSEDNLTDFSNISDEELLKGFE